VKEERKKKKNRSVGSVCPCAKGSASSTSPLHAKPRALPNAQLGTMTGHHVISDSPSREGQPLMSNPIGMFRSDLRSFWLLFSFVNKI